MPVYPVDFGYRFLHSFLKAQVLRRSFSLITTKSYMLNLLSHVGRFADSSNFTHST